MSFKFDWVKSSNVPYPNVWHRFTAKDLGTDELVEYRIEDLTEDRFEDALKHLKDNYLLDEPLVSSRSISHVNSILSFSIQSIIIFLCI